MACDISAYNVQGYIHKLETLKDYEFPFERLRRVEEQYRGKKKKVEDESGKTVEVDASSSDEEEKKDGQLDDIKEEEKEEDEEPSTADQTDAD